MMSSSPALFLFCASLLFICAFASEDLQEHTYEGTEHWGSLHPSYKVCTSGKRQSPVDIITKDVVVNKTMQPLTRKYHVFNASLTVDGGEVKIVFTGRGDLKIDGLTYKLKQMHWHSPSEHRINGVHYAAELHQVHVADDGSRAIVGILYEHGQPDPMLSMLKPLLDELAKERCLHTERKLSIPKFNSSFLRRRPRNYYRYLGSLTTPPCDENVVWSVVTKVKSISKDQIEALKAPLCEDDKKGNARPTQPLNGRTVRTMMPISKAN